MLAVNAALVAPLTALAGDRGAAAGTAAAEVIAALVQIVAVRRTDPRLRAPVKELPRVALAAAAALSPLALTLAHAPTIVALLLSNTIFFALLLLLRAVPAEVYDVLPARLAPLGRRFAAG